MIEANIINGNPEIKKVDFISKYDDLLFLSIQTSDYTDFSIEDTIDGCRIFLLSGSDCSTVDIVGYKQEIYDSWFICSDYSKKKIYLTISKAK